MTAPTSDAPADSSTAGDGGAADSLGPAPGTSPAGPGDNDTSDDGDGPRGRRTPGERVKSSSRDDDAPRDDADADTKPDQGKGKGDWKIEDLPPGAQKLIAELRKENGSRRTEASAAQKAREQAEQKAKAGDERFASATEAFMRALGLTPEADEPERSPEELVGELTTKYQQSRVELAVYRAAGGCDADPDALLDSRGFLTRAHALDPAADDFEDNIAAAIADAVEANPKLRAERAHETAPTAPSGGDFGGGPAGPTGPDDWSVDDFRRNRSKGRGSY